MKHFNEIPIEPGTTFGFRTVVERDPVARLSGNVCYLVRCVCGKLSTVAGSSLRARKADSCGCHGVPASSVVTKNPLYGIWKSMRQRCSNPNNPSYANYGGRGIKVDPSWESSFQTFFNDVGEKPPGMSLERIDNDGPYSKDNCCWADGRTQRLNQRPTGLAKQMVEDRDARISELEEELAKLKEALSVK